jgi:kynurenine formamidase
MKSSVFVDLSLPLVNEGGFGTPVQMRYIDHRSRGNLLADKFGVPVDDIQGRANAIEEFSYLNSHTATHFDAPWHYTDNVNGSPAMTIDQVPLNWCCGDGVVLDLSYKKAGDDISEEELSNAVSAINYAIKPQDIVLIMTGASVYYGQPGCELMNPGITREGTLWLADQGVRVVGIDAACWDRPPKIMLEEAKEGITGKYMQGHRAAGERGMCILEWLTNLDLLPATGFKIFAFPVKIERGSAGWVRAVAII